MEDWAKRIQLRLEEQADKGLTEAGIARVCKMAPNSVTQWFGRVKGKPPSRGIRGHHLVATAKYLNTTAEWIMTGTGLKDSSQVAGIDPDTLASAYVAVDKAVRNLGFKYDAAQIPEFLLYAYRERLEYPYEADKALLAAFDRNVQAEIERGRFRERQTGRPADPESGREDAQVAPAAAENRGSGR